jgi:hypothetical protein
MAAARPGERRLDLHHVPGILRGGLILVPKVRYWTWAVIPVIPVIPLIPVTPVIPVIPVTPAIPGNRRRNRAGM